jgi:hypothetical protein
MSVSRPHRRSRTLNRAVSDAEIRASNAGKCEPVSENVTGLKLDEVTRQAGGTWLTALELHGSGLALKRRDNVQGRLNPPLLGVARYRWNASDGLQSER